MARKKFTVYDIIVHAISLVTYALDAGTDILLVVHLLFVGKQLWGFLSLGFLLLPTLVMQVFSLKWHLDDGTLSCPMVIPHLLLISPVIRYIIVILRGLRSRQTGSLRDLDQALKEQSDVCILRLVEAFLESAPQLCLQLYILLSSAHFHWLIVLSAVSSLLSLGWTMCAYSDASRLAHRPNYHRRWSGMLVHCLWQMTMVASRITSLVLFAHALGAWIFLFTGIHWGLMTLWVMVLGSDFGEGLCSRTTFRFVAVFIYTFSFLNLNEGQARIRMAIFYSVMLVGNAILSGVWFSLKSASAPLGLTITLACVVYGGFLVGTLFMLLYYRCLHPSGPILFSGSDSKGNLPEMPKCFDLTGEKEAPPSADDSTCQQQSFSSSESKNSSSSQGQTTDSRSPPRMVGGEGMCSDVQSLYTFGSSDLSGGEKSVSPGQNYPNQSLSPCSLTASRDNPREGRCSWPGASDGSTLVEDGQRDSALPNIPESPREGSGGGDDLL